ncbi:two-component system response regulator CreB [Aquabacterium sp. A7-Y]|uniref:two-component system response regulator CreB n=1 Tax=Aquabacterium sp. A7-Y TaxID=1349605 RepID=UPI00223E128F|nr:two-component system response regulator CreB [Aquabacterium sp. A7-Y]MCW7538352.1 two-component system response regulator CreB [Aquabacterium sp. A7-Y]
MNTPARLLLLEDDPAIARTVAYALEREGFVVEHVLLVREAWARLSAADAPELAVLDVGLPDGSGLDLCRELRHQRPALPIVLLTARGDETDRVLGLELGADDYIAKPFSPRELVARVRALLRRARLGAPAPAAAAPASLFECDEGAARIRYCGQWLTLTRREYGLLRLLLRSPGRIHSREALLDAVWGQGADSTDRTVDTHVKTLRAKLREVRADLDPIATHRGMGYSLELPA